MVITVLGIELRVVEGSYEHTVTDDISQKSTTGSMIRTAKLHIAEAAAEGYSVKSDTVDIRAATTTALKSETSYTNTAGTSITQSSGTTLDSTAGTIYTIKSGGGSPTATNKVDINPS